MSEFQETLNSYVTAMIPRYCPDLDQLFPSKNNIQADRARGILQYMFTQYHIYMKHNPKYAPYLDRKTRYCFLNSKKLQKIGKKSYKQIIATLIDHKIIQVNAHPDTGTEHYMPGRAKEYRIHPRLIRMSKAAGTKTYRREKISNQVVIGVIKEMYDERYPNKLKRVCQIEPIYQDIMAFTDSLTLDLEGIDHDLQSGKLQDPKETLYFIAETFTQKYLRYVSYDKLGKRLFHHLCNVPSALRNYLIHPDGEPLTEIDFANSHPWVFGSCLVHPEIFIEFAPEFKPVYDTLQKYAGYNDVRRFHYTCYQGEFIPNWLFVSGVIEKIGDPYTKEQKDAAKELLFHNIFYGSPDNHFEKGSPEYEGRFRTEMQFKIEYPNVHKALLELKRTPASKLPFIKQTPRSNGKKGTMRSTPSIMMQAMESHLVYKKIGPLLQNSNIRFTTIHDSFILSSNEVNQAVQIIENVFLDLGIKPPKLRIRELNGINIDITPKKVETNND